MSIFVSSVTVSFIGFYWGRLRAVARWRRRPAGIELVDDELGLARLALPIGWRQAHDLNEGACVQAVHPLYGRHVIVISESLEDYAIGVTVHEHAEITRNLLTRGVKVMKISGPELRSVSGFEAVQFEIEALHDNTWLKYLHTTVAGRRAFHQIIGWATQSCYKREVFEGVLDGFTEQPGPDPIRRAAPQTADREGRPFGTMSSRVH